MATGDWFYKIGKQNGSLSHIVDILLGVGGAALGFIFLHDTKRASTPKAKRQRRLAIFMIVMGGLVSVIGLLRSFGPN